MAKPFDTALTETPSPESMRIRAVEEYTNDRQETITRMTFDLVVRVHVGKDDKAPEINMAHHTENERSRFTPSRRPERPAARRLQIDDTIFAGT